MHVGNQIVKIQEAHKVSCLDLAESLGVAPQQLTRWRNAEDLKLSIVKNVAGIFGLSIDEFIAFGETETTK